MKFFFLAVQELPELNFGMLFVRMLVFLALVLALIYFLLRKVLPLFVPGVVASKGTVRIVERIALDQKRSLLVAEIQDKVYLLGSAEGQINVLMELDREKIALQKAAAPRQPTFQEILKRAFKAKP
jgi:flagellar biogenesis protein FliO